MRISDNLSPFWQNVVAVLMILGYGLTFIAAISALWGWDVVGLVSCGVLVVSAIDERKGINAALRGKLGRNDRLFAIYLLAIATAAVVINFVFIYRWMLGVL